MTKRVDVLEHLVGMPEESILRQRAREMYLSPMWKQVPEWTKPADVSGEISASCMRCGDEHSSFACPYRDADSERTLP